MFNLFVIPSATTTIAEITEYSSPWFAELLPIVSLAVGVALGVGFAVWLMNLLGYGLIDKFVDWQHRNDDKF